MPKKCESCKWYIPHRDGFSAGQCAQPELLQATIDEGFALFNVSRARELCDRESNGVFVYFEPVLSSPSSEGGVAFASNDGVVAPAAKEATI